MVRYPHRITPRKGVFLHALGKHVLSICSTYRATPLGYIAEQDRAYVLRKFLIDLRNFFFFSRTQAISLEGCGYKNGLNIEPQGNK